MFPWQSASNGREVTQTMHLNPASGRWLPDRSYLQRHVNAAIVYNVWQYFLATGDVEFLRFYGAEMMLDIARFWSSIATYNHLLDRYEIKRVMGPDEYHDGYPDRAEAGLDNNAYTNLMAVWCLCRAFDVLDALPPSAVRDLRERLEIDDQELDRWDEVSRKMRVCFHDGVITQFEGYDLLEELDWEAYRHKYGDIQRLDRLLEAEGDSPNRYQVAKQADVMMLFYLLSADELGARLERLGYDYDNQLIPRSIADLRAPDFARLHTQPRRPRVDPCPSRPGTVVASVPAGPLQRRRRHARRHDQGGHPPRRHGRYRRSPPALLHRHRAARRRPAPAPRAPPRVGLARVQHPLSPTPRAPRVHPAACPGVGGSGRGRVDHR